LDNIGRGVSGCIGRGVLGTGAYSADGQNTGQDGRFEVLTLHKITQTTLRF